MKHKALRITLIVIEAIIGLGALGGGITILTGAFDQWLLLAWLQDTPFSDYTIPGLILLIVVGGGMLLAAATVFVQREWAVLLTQAIIPSTVAQQALMSGLGLVIFGLASYLWMSEYREHHFPTSPVSHA